MLLPNLQMCHCPLPFSPHTLQVTGTVSLKLTSSEYKPIAQTARNQFPIPYSIKTATGPSTEHLLCTWPSSTQKGSAMSLSQ